MVGRFSDFVSKKRCAITGRPRKYEGYCLSGVKGPFLTGKNKDAEVRGEKDNFSRGGRDQVLGGGFIKGGNRGHAQSETSKGRYNHCPGQDRIVRRAGFWRMLEILFSRKGGVSENCGEEYHVIDSGAGYAGPVGRKKEGETGK